MVKETGVAVTMVMLLTGGAAAQGAQIEPQDSRPQQSTVEPAPVRSQDTGAQAEAMRGQMLTYGAVLQTAVQRGAEAVTQKARKFNPSAEVRLGGPTDILFFRLDDVGPIFMVRVPGLRPNIPFELTRQTLLQQRRPGIVQPTSLAAPGAPSPSAAPAAAPPLPAPFLDDLLVLSDTEAAYTREVKNAIIVAMLDNSQPLRIVANEWLTIVAHDSAPPDPRVPTSQTDFSTIKFQIRGSDLADYRAGRISVDEARKKVKITEE